MKKWDEDSRTYDPKELKTDLGKYLVIFLFMTLTIGFVSGFHTCQKRDDTDPCAIFYFCVS